MKIFEQTYFEEKHRHYFDFQRRSGQLPVQKEVGFVRLGTMATFSFFS